VRPIRSAHELAREGIFESDEELDEFLADLHAFRHSVASLAIRDRLPPVLLARLAGSLTCVTFVTVGETAGSSYTATRGASADVTS